MGDTYSSVIVEDLYPNELEAYNAGYDWNEKFGEKKF
jgi:hypothetical protein